MKTRVSMMLASTGVAALFSLGLATPSSAAAAQPEAAPREAATLGEIVVTARRKSESLQEVPQTVNAVTSDSIQKLSLTTFKDIQTVVPGLSLEQGNSAVGAAASLRGVTYNALVGGQPTVAEYINDAPVQALEMFQSLFDVGQIEVLKGPQGTTRGVSAPSGAITFTTRRPDLGEFGGYVSGLVTDLRGRNVQGALNIPLIKDVLGVRVAAVVDENGNDGVRSINSAVRPYNKTGGERISVSFEPNDKLNANIMYQHLDHTLAGFTQVEGPGFGVNPTISASQRVGVQDQPNTFSQHFDRVSAQIDSHIFGQHLSYVGSYNFFKLKMVASQDTANVLPFADPEQKLLTTSEGTTHEIRLASDPAPGRFFDYTVGAYYSWTTPQTTGGQPAAYLAGAFGPPNLPPNASAFNPTFSIPVNFGGPPSPIQETSFFGSVTFHLPWDTELSGGVRHIISIGQSNLVTELGNGTIALPASIFGGSCGGRPSTYPGFCDFALNTASVISNTTNRTSDRPNIYNVSLSHHINRDLLVYANTGTSWGSPLPTFGLQGEITASTDPLVSSFTFHPATSSRAYEVGVKSTFLDGRARVNFALYRQRYHNLFIGVPGINYLNVSPVSSAVSQANFTASVDALVQGADLDAAFQITPEWNIAVQASYAHTGLEGSLTPCNTFDANGNPTFNRQFVSVCPGGRASLLPLWNLTAQTEYVHPVRDNVDGFIRGLFNYYPENKYVEPNFTAPSYSLVNLYLGVRSHDGAWEASIFARNAFNTDKVLDRSQQTIAQVGGLATSFSALNLTPTYYTVANSTPQREVGVTVRYAWGSR